MYAKKKGLLRARSSILTTIGQCAHRPRFGYGPKIGIGKRASFRSSKLTGSRRPVLVLLVSGAGVWNPGWAFSDRVALRVVPPLCYHTLPFRTQAAESILLACGCAIIRDMTDELVRVPSGLTTQGLLGRRYLARIVDSIIIGALAVAVLSL